MKKNDDLRNRCLAYDLADDEVTTFYRGSGRATVVLDGNDNIIACYYHQLDELPSDYHVPWSYLKKVYPLAARVTDGMMSCHQFCPDERD
ncbi:MAG: hypothetical protein AB7I30_03385 [Isosphaeraceae bacterium]